MGFRGVVLLDPKQCTKAGTHPNSENIAERVLLTPCASFLADEIQSSMILGAPTYLPSSIRTRAYEASYGRTKRNACTSNA